MSELLSPPDVGRPTLRLLKDDDDTRAVERRRFRGDSVHSRFRGGLAGSVLRRIRAYIDAHIGERISLDDLAHQAGVSRFHFARQFRHYRNTSPRRFRADAPA